MFNCFHSQKNAIIFDLDKTIGSFESLSQIERILNNIIDIHDLFNYFPQVFRPNIFFLFKSISKLKSLDIINKVVLYTNNTGGKRWVDKIISYIHTKVPDLFDDIIYGLYVNSNEISDTRRTNIDKTLYDVYKILNLNEKTNILYFDDIYYPEMDEINVKYVIVKPYTISITLETIFNTFKYKPNIIELLQNNYHYNEYLEYNNSNEMCLQLLHFIDNTDQ